MANKTLMSIGAHADDVEIQSGGTLLKYRDRGYEICYVMSTNNMSGGWIKVLPDGTQTHRAPPWYEIMPQRILEANKAAGYFGTEAIHLNHPQRHYIAVDGKQVELRYGNHCPDCVPPDTPSILTAHEDKASVKKLAGLILEKNPEAILTHGLISGNPEHSCTGLLVVKACRLAADSGYKGMLLFWTELSSAFGDFYQRFETFIDITSYAKQAVDAIRIHACQMGPTPEMHDWPWWDSGKLCGCTCAQVFIIGITGSCKGAFADEILKNREVTKKISFAAAKYPSTKIGDARGFLGAGEYKKAAKLFDMAISEMPEMNHQKKKAFYFKGIALEALGAKEEAIACFKKIYAADKTYLDTAKRLGIGNK